MPLLSLVLLACCDAGGGPGNHPADASAAPDSATAQDDAGEAGGSDGAVPSACSIALVSNDLEAWRQSIRDHLTGLGHSVINSEAQSGDAVSLLGSLGAFDNSDPGAGSIDWVTALPGFPVPSDELEVTLVNDTGFDSRVVLLGRRTVGDIDAKFFRPAVHLSMQKDAETADRWQISMLQVWGSVALAGVAEAAALASCSVDSDPPLAPLMATTLDGLMMSGCTPTGEYSYAPSANDIFTFENETDWVLHEDSTWRVRRKGAIEVHPDNYWDNVVEADSYCPGHDATPTTVGFTIEVDAVSGELLHSRPGIGCVVC